MSLLLQAGTIGGVTLKNRIVMPPMCMYHAEHDGHPNPFHLLHYGSKALGGVGLIIVEATAIESRGRISENDLGIWEDAHIPTHRTLTSICHDNGAKIALQLAHAGRKCECSSEIPVAPSAIAFSPEAPYRIPTALALEEIEEIKGSFVRAALRAKDAGYDMVEIHGAHGYLLCEFLSPLSNRRNDRYGGTFENRCRLLLEVTEAVKVAINLPVIVRISAEEWMEEGWNIEDSIALSKALKTAGADIIHVSAGGNQPLTQTQPPFVPLYQADYAKRIRNEGSIPTIAVGLITTPAEGEALLMGGVCDFVAYGRSLLRNPNLALAAAKEFHESDKIPASFRRGF
ncbi:MAG: NADH:flavin oxidoreductase/NADH oxidase [Sulfuricurvum sp.]|jgi:NADPH2 dehydrogenase|uniref:NADH:flavin oxidoreductase/NADH oxidase n=1 Tax=Sulfuricurvum sp. TaxID=2025608 RepID=UPI0025EA3A0B|nr:NADH:flavin oxidoreductase/NADH oxidase [Sulfuricurvum sp.]MCK9372822.1 NADH:flavin oxidoreductase/NADH oxidase [Sulfuricurvum sp.]